MVTMIKLDRERYLHYGMRAISMLEKHFNCKMSQLEFDFASMGVNDIVAMIHAGLISDDKSLTHEDVLDMLDSCDNISDIFTAIGAAMEESFGVEDKTGKNKKPAVLKPKK